MHKEIPKPAFEELDMDEASDAAIETGEITVRPDGYYWLAPDGRKEFGPFETLELAQADMEIAMADEQAPEPGETLQEAEDEIGISDWIDPDTGELAEGHSPRFDGE